MPANTTIHRIVNVDDIRRSLREVAICGDCRSSRGMVEGCWGSGRTGGGVIGCCLASRGVIGT